MAGIYVIGLTGSIGMGKSTVASMFKKRGCYVIDSDAATHELLGFGGLAVGEVLSLCPEAKIRDAGGRVGVDRDILSRHLRVEGGLGQLEEILHPKIADMRHGILAELRELSKKDGVLRVAIIEAALLLEKGLQGECDCVVVVSASKAIQRERVLARGGMSEEKFAYILSKQMSDEEKCSKADLVLDSEKNLEDMQDDIDKLLRDIRKNA